MTTARIYKRGSIALLVMGSLASLAMPMSPRQMGDSKDVRDSVDGALDQIHGTAVGTINMPTLTGLGILTAVGQSEQGGVYMLDAELTSAIPGLFDHHNRVAFGGLYGELSQTPVGDSQDGQTGFDGVVEGTWRMDKAFEGNYDALVYQREGNNLELVGRITGVFRVNETPVSGPGVGDAVDNKKDFDTPFGTGPVIGDAVDSKKDLDTPFGPAPGIGDAVGSKKGFDTPYGEGPAFADGATSKKDFDTPFDDGPTIGDAVDSKKDLDTPFAPVPARRTRMDDAVDSKKDLDTPFGPAPGIGDAVDNKKDFDTPFDNGPTIGDAADSKKDFDTPFDDGPTIGDAVDSKKDLDTPFAPAPGIGDAVGSKKGFDTPYGQGPAFADGVDSKKAVDSPYMPPTSHDGAAVIGDGSLDAQHHAKNVELSGATKLQFKLLD